MGIREMEELGVALGFQACVIDWKGSPKIETENTGEVKTSGPVMDSGRLSACGRPAGDARPAVGWSLRKLGQEVGAEDKGIGRVFVEGEIQKVRKSVHEKSHKLRIGPWETHRGETEVWPGQFTAGE